MIQKAIALRRRVSLRRGKPLSVNCPSPLLPLPVPPCFSPTLPILQARVMSLSPDSWHVNEDVMRLTDMQLIRFPPPPCDDAPIKGHAAHKQFKRGKIFSVFSC